MVLLRSFWRKHTVSLVPQSLLNLCVNMIIEDPVVCVQVATKRSLAVIAMENLRDTGSLDC